MAVLEIFKVALNNLSHQGIRSYLTLIGVIIGIAAIVTLIALGDGVNTAVKGQFEKLGANTLFVAPSSSGIASGRANPIGSSKNLKDSDIEKIRRIPEVSDVIAPIATSDVIEFKSEQATATIEGIEPKDAKSITETGFVEIAEGRNFKSGDVFSAAIGSSFADASVFKKKIRIGDRILIEGKSFKVIAIMKKNSQSFGGGPNVNSIVFLTEKGYRAVFPKAEPMFMLVKTRFTEDVPQALEKVEKVFEKSYGKDQKDFTVISSEQILEKIGQVLGIIQLFLVGIAGISLLVGGIGIMNTMIMAVMERTREIGVMKAIGATNSLILQIFLLEAGFIGMAGGLIGITLGYFFAFIVGIIANLSGFALTVSINPILIIGALVFSMSVGMISGAYPARRASRLDPVDALRSGE